MGYTLSPVTAKITRLGYSLGCSVTGSATRLLALLLLGHWLCCWLGHRLCCSTAGSAAGSVACLAPCSATRLPALLLGCWLCCLATGSAAGSATGSAARLLALLLDLLLARLLARQLGHRLCCSAAGSATWLLALPLPRCFLAWMLGGSVARMLASIIFLVLMVLALLLPITRMLACCHPWLLD
jgi:hypothetical protein